MKTVSFTISESELKARIRVVGTAGCSAPGILTHPESVYGLQSFCSYCSTTFGRSRLMAVRGSWAILPMQIDQVLVLVSVAPDKSRWVSYVSFIKQPQNVILRTSNSVGLILSLAEANDRCRPSSIIILMHLPAY